MAASLPIVTVSISPEVVFSGTYSVNYLEQSNLIMFLKVTGIDSRNIKLWRTMAASFPIVTVTISPEVVFFGPYSVNYLEQSKLTWFLKVIGINTRNIVENDGSFVTHSYGVDIS